MRGYSIRVNLKRYQLDIYYMIQGLFFDDGDKITAAMSMAIDSLNA